MKLSIIGLAVAGATVWGLGVFLVGVANLIWPGYGQEFLRLVASIYPGYHGTATFVQVIVGTLYAALDWFIGGAALAWLYNRFVPA